MLIFCARVYVWINEGAYIVHAKFHVNSNANKPIALTLLDDFQKKIA